MEYVEKYEERLTLYIDLLGFKHILSSTIDSKNEDKFEEIIKIQKIYEIIYKSLNTNTIKDKISGKKVTIFSDSIVVSMIPKRPTYIANLLNSIRNMIVELVDIEVLCRGAITYGKLIHTDQFVYGPALVEAHILESKSANYPRVILDYSILKELTDLKNRVSLKNDFLKKDLDGMYYLDYFDLFSGTDDFAKVFNDDDLALEYTSRLKDFISTSLKKYTRYNHADIRVKYIWMREKFNPTIKIVDNLFSTKELLVSLNLTKPILSSTI